MRKAILFGAWLDPAGPPRQEADGINGMSEVEGQPPTNFAKLPPPKYPENRGFGLRENASASRKSREIAALFWN
jgi:hypothetical protein